MSRTPLCYTTRYSHTTVSAQHRTVCGPAWTDHIGISRLYLLLSLFLNLSTEGISTELDLIQLFFYEDCKILKWEEIKSIFIF